MALTFGTRGKGLRSIALASGSPMIRELAILPDCEPVAADSRAVLGRIAPDSYIGNDELEPRKVAKKLEIDSLEARAGEYGGSAVDAMDDCRDDWRERSIILGTEEWQEG
jgi:hypothetical protein